MHLLRELPFPPKGLCEERCSARDGCTPRAGAKQACKIFTRHALGNRLFVNCETGGCIPGHNYPPSHSAVPTACIAACIACSATRITMRRAFCASARPSCSNQRATCPSSCPLALMAQCPFNEAFPSPARSGRLAARVTSHGTWHGFLHTVLAFTFKVGRYPRAGTAYHAHSRSSKRE